MAALSAAGFETTLVHFAGFPPARGRQRAAWFDEAAGLTGVLVFYEAPHRIRDTLEELVGKVGDRDAAVGRELTKVHEELVVRPIDAWLNVPTEQKGEYVIVVPPSDETHDRREVPSDEQVADYYQRIAIIGLSTKRNLVREVANHFGLSARTVYAALERAKKQRSVSGT